MTEHPPVPDTIVLIHGFWVTPRSWEDWIARYEQAGYRVLAPAYPGFEVEVEALNADPSPIEAVTVPQIVEHLQSVVGALDRPPIIMGHSAGGVFTQILLDRGFGAAGVAINSAPTEGVKVVPLSQVKASFPVRRPVVGLFADQEIRMHSGPLFVGHPYEMDREVVALSGSRRTESLWIRTRVFMAGGDEVLATMLLNAAYMKDSFPGYAEEQKSQAKA